MTVNEAARHTRRIPYGVLFLVVNFAPACPSQEPAKADAEPPFLVLDDRKAIAIEAVLDPLGQAMVVGKDEAGEVVADLRLLFPVMKFPGVGGLSDQTGPARVRIGIGGKTPNALERYTLGLTAFGEKAIAGHVVWREETREHRLNFHAVPVVRAMQPALLTGARAWPAFPSAVDRPNREDLVFCAFGNAGTGLIGQRRVARSIASLSATGPIDFVLLLGDNFYPNGPQSTDDPLWASRFEEVYDRKLLDVPFYAVLGDHDHAGSMRPLIDYSKRSRRWTMPSNSYTFEVESHGKRIAFFAVDTNSIVGDIANPQNRIANRMLVHHLHTSKADWKIVFGHDSFVSNRSANAPKLAERLDIYFERAGVDLYICGDGHFLELLSPRNGTTHVISGGGAGPELATPMTVGEDTVFGHTGGGFTWFRFDGKTLEISFRDTDGKVLFVHHLKKGGG